MVKAYCQARQLDPKLNVVLWEKSRYVLQSYKRGNKLKGCKKSTKPHFPFTQKKKKF
jgi:hypothetical protein